MRERLTSAAVEPDVISKAAATAAQRAAAEAKVDEARRQKEMTDEGQRIAKLKRERGVAQLIKGRIVMVKEPGIGEVRTKDGVGNGGGEAAEGVEGERKKKKKKKATLNEDLQEETGKTDTELKAVVGNVTDENGTVETPKKKKRKKKKADTTTTGG